MLIMRIMRKMVKNTFLFTFSHVVVVFPFCFKYYDPEIMFFYLCPFLDKDCMRPSFHGNYIGGKVAILLLKAFF